MRRCRYYLTQGWVILLVWSFWTIGFSTPGAAATPQILSEILVVYQNGNWQVVLTGSKSMTYKAIKASDPLRLVVDLPNTLNEMHPMPLVVNNDVIGTIRTAQIVHDPQPLTRVEIGLNRNATYKITRQGEKIWVSFNTAQPITEVGPSQIKPVVKPKSQQYPVTEEVATHKPSTREPIRPARPSGRKSPPPANKVLSVHQLKMDKELRYYIIADGKLADYTAFHLTNPPRLVVDLMEVKSTALKDTLSFGGPWVRKVRVGQYTNKVRVVFDLIPEAGVPYEIILGSDRLVVSFKPGSSFPPR